MELKRKNADRYTEIHICNHRTQTHSYTNTNIQPHSISLFTKCYMANGVKLMKNRNESWKNIEKTNMKMKWNTVESRLLPNEIMQKFFYFIEQTPLLTATFPFALQSHSYSLTIVTRIRVFKVSMLRMMIRPANAKK